MATSEQLESANLYREIMEEIKLRISAIDAGTSGQLQTLPALLVREHCFFQIRMVCELIAIACLVAHGELTKGTNLRTKWQPEQIMDGLERLHPDFFPHAIQPFQNQPRPFLEFIPRPGMLTKKELLALHGECNRVMHVGSLKNLLKGRFPKQIHYPDISAKAQKLNDLLEAHTVFMKGHKTLFICSFRSAGDNFNVQVVIAEAKPPPQEFLDMVASDR